jgi:hypothetical protein
MKKIGLILVGLALAAGTIINVNLNSQNDLSTDNVEALSSCESPVKNWYGQSTSITCTNSSGQTYPLTVCDFDDGYLTVCNGRSVD